MGLPAWILNLWTAGTGEGPGGGGSPVYKPAKWAPGLTQQIALTRCLRAYWPLWEAAGVQVGSLVGTAAAAGTLENGAAWGIGPDGTMVTFDKTANPSHRISVPSALSSLAGNTITLLMRVLVESYDTYGNVLFGTTTGSTVFWQFRDDTEVSVQSVSIKPLTITTNFADGLWHAIAMVSRGTAGVEVWWDGKLIGSSATAGTALVAGAKNFFIGDWIGNPGTSWQHDGAIAEVALFDRALPQAEIEWHNTNPFALCTLARNPHLIDLAIVSTAVSGPDYNLVLDRKHYVLAMDRKHYVVRGA